MTNYIYLLKLDINRSKDSAQDWTSATVRLLKIWMKMLNIFSGGERPYNILFTLLYSRIGLGWTDSYLKSSLSLCEQSSVGLGGFTLKLKNNFHEWIVYCLVSGCWLVRSSTNIIYKCYYNISTFYMNEGLCFINIFFISKNTTSQCQ